MRHHQFERRFLGERAEKEDARDHDIIERRLHLDEGFIVQPDGEAAEEQHHDA